MVGVNSCYKFVTNQKATWSQALGLCRDMGGYLAALETEPEIFWMKGYRSYHSIVSKYPAWIGGYKKDGAWYWKGDVEDYPVTAADWAKGQPDNCCGGQNCLALFGDSDPRQPPTAWYRFDDDHCNDAWPFICEKPMN